MNARTRWTLLPLLFAVALLGACEDKAPDAAPDLSKQAKAMEGGTPIPTGAMRILFPWTGKQSVMCVGANSVERQIAYIDFGTEQNDATDSMLFGQIAIDKAGAATGEFVINATRLRSGDAKRDGYLMGGAWLDAESNPTLAFNIKKMKRLLPTVFHVEGSWYMRGVAKDVSFLANARHVAEMKYLGKNIARVKGAFEINLKDFGMDNGTVGTPACSDTWQVDVVLLGLIKPFEAKAEEKK